MMKRIVFVLVALLMTVGATAQSARQQVNAMFSRGEYSDAAGLCYGTAAMAASGEQTFYYDLAKKCETCLGLRKKAGALYSKQDYNGALDVYSRLLKINPSDPVAISRVSACKKKLQEAVEEAAARAAAAEAKAREEAEREAARLQQEKEAAEAKAREEAALAKARYLSQMCLDNEHLKGYYTFDNLRSNEAFLSNQIENGLKYAKLHDLKDAGRIFNSPQYCKGLNGSMALSLLKGKFFQMYLRLNLLKSDTSSFSISFWVHNFGWNAGMLFSTETPDFAAENFANCLYVTKKYDLVYRFKGLPGDKTREIVVPSVRTDHNKWTHVVLTVDVKKTVKGNSQTEYYKQVKIYINGELKATGNEFDTLEKTAYTQYFNFGPLSRKQYKLKVPMDKFSVIELDNVRVYLDEALDSSEIGRIYNAEKPKSN